MTTPSQLPTQLTTAPQAPATEQVSPDTVETAKKLHTLKTRSANIGRNYLRPAALGVLGGIGYALLNRPAKVEESSENYDVPSSDPTE